MQIDSDGTLTDLVAVDQCSGCLETLKVSSTPQHPALTVLDFNLLGDWLRDVLEGHANE